MNGNTYIHVAEHCFRKENALWILRSNAEYVVLNRCSEFDSRGVFQFACERRFDRGDMVNQVSLISWQGYQLRLHVIDSTKGIVLKEVCCIAVNTHCRYLPMDCVTLAVTCLVSVIPSQVTFKTTVLPSP